MRLLLLFLLTTLTSRATHIVGGDMQYKYIGSNQYEVTIIIYRDCSSNTKFDGFGTGPGTSPFSLGLIQEGSINSTTTYNITIDNKDITPVYNTFTNPCMDTPTNICVEYATYKTIITVPNPSKAYYLIYQRCCRNSSINNIVPTSVTPSTQMPGATFLIRIPPTNTYFNNSPKFASFPPKFICKGVQFTYNHSATDIDGDSLTYELYTPYTGLSSSGPTTLNPTFDTNSITWKSPYSLGNMLGGTPLTIDANGVLTCTPNQIGQYVVGVRVNEWRNGVKINSVNRDFQFNVTNCNGPTASIPQKTGSIDPLTGIGFFDINCDDFTIVFKNTSVGATKYKWDFGDPSSGVNNYSTATFPTHTYSDTGTFNVKMWATGADTLCSDTFRTKVAIYPYFYVGFLSNNVCQDSLAIFTDTSKHKYSIINKWDWNFGDNMTSTVQNPKHLYASGGTFNVSLTVSTNKGCVKNIKKDIVIYHDPFVDFTPPSPICELADLNFMDASSVSPPSFLNKYVWDFNNGDIKNVANPTTKYSNAGIKTVKLIVFSNFGCSDTISKNVTINPLPTVVASPDRTICWNEGTQLSATGANTYKWTPGATLNDSTISNPFATPLSYPIPKKYFVFGTDNKLCTNVDSLVISYFPKPNVNAGLDTSVCLNPSPFVFRDSVRLTATGAISYTWSPVTGLSNPNVFNPLSKPNKNMDYIVEGTDINNCKVKDTVRVIVLDPALDLIPFTDTFLCENDSIFLRVLDQGLITKYFWTPGSFLSNRNIRSPLFFPQDTTWYLLNVQNYCYTKNDSVRLDVRRLPKIDLPNLDSICFGKTYQINSVGSGNFKWKFDPTLSNVNIPNPIAKPNSTTTYVVTITDQYGCKNIDSLLLFVYYNPPLAIANKPKFVCQGIPYQVEVYSCVDCKFKWTPTFGVFTDSSQNPLITAFDDIKYTVLSTNIHGCSSKDSMNLVVQKPIKPVAPSPIKFCENSFADLNASGGLYYKWRPGYNINDSNSRTPQVYPQRNFIYTVYISNDCFMDSAKVNVLIDTLQKINAGRDTTIIRGSSIVLNVTNAVGLVEWSPNYAIDDQYAFAPRVSPTYNTVYYVRLRDNRGCVTEDSVLVVVIGNNILVLPTGFTPNGDGINDAFGIVKQLNIEKLNSFNIFNRWGEMVFSTTSLTEKWDGTYKGSEAQMGTYVWTISARTFDGEQIKQSGNITLLR